MKKEKEKASMKWIQEPAERVDWELNNQEMMPGRMIKTVEMTMEMEWILLALPPPKALIFCPIFLRTISRIIDKNKKIAPIFWLDMEKSPKLNESDWYPTRKFF